MLFVAYSLAKIKLVSRVSVQSSTTLILPWSSMCQTPLKGFSTTCRLGLLYLEHCSAEHRSSTAQSWKDPSYHELDSSPQAAGLNCVRAKGVVQDMQQGCTEQMKEFLDLQECKSLQLNNEIMFQSLVPFPSHPTMLRTSEILHLFIFTSAHGVGSLQSMSFHWKMTKHFCLLIMLLSPTVKGSSIDFLSCYLLLILPHF